MRTLHKYVNNYKKATNGETDRLLVIEAMEKILTVTEERLSAVNVARHSVSTVAELLHDANDILEEEIGRLSSGKGSYVHEMDKHNRLVVQIRDLVSFSSPALVITMLSPENLGQKSIIKGEL
jgi:hypothetical protein